jgi:hypothetical protein
MNVLNKDMNEINHYKYLDINGDNIKIRWAVKKFPESFAIDGLLHYEFLPPGQSYCASSAGRDSGVCTEPHITQPPCSPDLAPSGCWLFPTLKVGLKGTRSAATEGITSNGTAELRKIPEEAFRRCFQQWQDRWINVVCARALL